MKFNFLSKVILVGTVLGICVLQLALPSRADEGKDGIRSTATGNCWGDGQDCKKGEGD
ncbi:MAG TPA: hypothetical protein PK185_07815 [Cyclobacteriaceae bacterium]|nr:hypothetical protein [Cyclobacteriaceae bacterium]